MVEKVLAVIVGVFFLFLLLSQAPTLNTTFSNITANQSIFVQSIFTGQFGLASFILIIGIVVFFKIVLDVMK